MSYPTSLFSISLFYFCKTNQKFTFSTNSPAKPEEEEVTLSSEENFFSVTEALVKTITEMNWPVIEQDEDDENMFSYKVTE